MNSVQFGIALMFVTSHVSGLASLVSPPKPLITKETDKKMVLKIKAICNMFPKVCQHNPKKLEVIIKDGRGNTSDVEIDVVERRSRDNRRTVLYHFKNVKLSLLKNKLRQRLG